MACSPSQREEQGGSTVGEDDRIEAKLIHPHELAKDLHTQESYFLLDCRPLLAYNTCHITGISYCQLSPVMYMLMVVNINVLHLYEVWNKIGFNVELD